MVCFHYSKESNRYERIKQTTITTSGRLFINSGRLFVSFERIRTTEASNSEWAEEEARRCSSRLGTASGTANKGSVLVFLITGAVMRIMFQETVTARMLLQFCRTVHRRNFEVFALDLPMDVPLGKKCFRKFIRLIRLTYF